MKVTNVYIQNLTALYDAINGNGANLIINSGGQGSSKSYSILQAIYKISQKYEYPLKITFCSYALPHLKQGIVSDFDRILTEEGLNLGVVKSRPEQPVYKIGNATINTYGIEGNLAMAHGPRRDILFINECNRKISYEVYDQLFSRSKITIVDFNPDREFWLHTKVIPNFQHVMIKSTFLDNPYLPEGELNNILAKKDKKGFENWWRVYGMGELGKYEGMIFDNWVYGDFDTSLPFCYALDWGYYPDPIAISKIAVDYSRKRIYAKEIFSGTEINNIDQLFKSVGIQKHDLIICDTNEPRTRANLVNAGYNIQNAVKLEVVEDIREMKEYEIVVTEDSYNMITALNNYIWNDKRASIPGTEFKHFPDTIRYGFRRLTAKNIFMEIHAQKHLI